MTPETWQACRGKLRRKFIICNFLTMTLMVFILPINALDIPLDDLLVLSQFHCFNENNICISRLEYCNSFARECRPCTADICARKGGDDFPLQCSLNCSIAQARLAAIKATDKLRDLNETNSDIRALNTELNISVSDLKAQNQELNATLQETKESLETSKENLLLLKQEVDGEKDSCRWTISGLSGGIGCSFLIILILILYKTKKCRKSTIDKGWCLTTDEECALFQKEENTSKGKYCEGKLKGTCETNEDTQKTIATTQDKGVTSSRINHALQSDSTTKVTEDKESANTESKLADDPCLKTEVVKYEVDKDGAAFNGAESNPDISSGFDSAPLKKAPSLDLKTFEMEEIA